MQLVAKRKQKTKSRSPEQDSAYFLKLVLYLILGSLWVKVNKGDAWQFPLPVGFIIGLLFVQHEHFQIDRKIEYAVLLLAMFLGFWMPFGIYISM
jgi:hypothetical protein